MRTDLPRIPAEAKLADKLFFNLNRDRNLRLRRPIDDEYQREYRQFGLHEERRRRVIVARVPYHMMQRHNIDFIRVPFVMFADETVEDTDAVLAPILDEMMRDAAEGYGMKRR